MFRAALVLGWIFAITTGSFGGIYVARDSESQRGGCVSPKTPACRNDPSPETPPPPARPETRAASDKSNNAVRNGRKPPETKR